MHIRKEIEELVFNKYGLIKGDPLSIKSQAIKLWEEDTEFWNSKTEDEEKKELGDIIFVFETLLILMDGKNFQYKEIKEFNDVKSFGLPSAIKQLNKLNKIGLSSFKGYINYLLFYVFQFQNDNEKYEKAYYDLLESTIIKNKGRSGEVINGCFVKSEDV